MTSFSALFNLHRRLLWLMRIRRWKIGYPDPELHYLARLCNPGKISLDVGAAQGVYVIHLLARSLKVVAFEPRKTAAVDLKRMFADAAVESIQSLFLITRSQGQ